MNIRINHPKFKHDSIEVSYSNYNEPFITVSSYDETFGIIYQASYWIHDLNEIDKIIDALQQLKEKMRLTCTEQ